MDDVDREIINSIFPNYLLQQPLAYDLWALYYAHKRLFRKNKPPTTYGDNSNVPDGVQGPGSQLPGPMRSAGNKLNDPQRYTRRLSRDVRRQIWQKLEKLGVLGTMPYEASSDDYLVQVFKYFYPGAEAMFRQYSPGGSMPVDNKDTKAGCESEEQLSWDHNGDSNGRQSGVQEPHSSVVSGYVNGNTLRRASRNEHYIQDELPRLRNPWSSGAILAPGHQLGQVGTEEGGVSMSEGVNFGLLDRELRHSEETKEQNDGDNDHDSDVDINTSEQPPGELPNKSNKDANPFTGSAASQRLKNNSVNPSFYDFIGYALPTSWVVPPNNSILLSSDGISRLTPNPKWKPHLKHEGVSDTSPGGTIGSSSSSAYTRNRLRSSISGIAGQQKPNYEYVTACADKSLPVKNMAIFYFEVRVLSVSSSQGSRNSNIIVGFKLRSLDAEIKDGEENSDQNNSKNMGNVLLESTTTTVHFTEMNRRRSSTLRDLGVANMEPTSNPTAIYDIRTSLMGNNNDLSADKSDKSSSGGFYGFSGYDGRVANHIEAKSYNKPYGKDDVIGCGVNFIDGTIFFTKNGTYLGDAYTDILNFSVTPAIALRPGNSVRTNFGIYEEFVFDIVGYQNGWKANAYQNVFGSLSTAATRTKGGTQTDGKDSKESNGDTVASKPFLLGRDTRFVKGRLTKPDTRQINTLNSNDDSITSTLNVIINDYLIHEGLIGVAREFLNDLDKDCIEDQELQLEGLGGDNSKGVIQHNEEQIRKEERLLGIRYEVRKLISIGDVTGCIEFISKELPDILDGNVELLFELKLAEYLTMIVNCNNGNCNIGDLIENGRKLCDYFLYNDDIEVTREVKLRFESQLSSVSSLLAYNNPLTEAPEDLRIFLTDEYLRDRLFQIVNAHILKLFNKDGDPALNGIIGYTRSMLSVLSAFESGNLEDADMENGDPVPTIQRNSYQRIINIDEDLLQI